MIYADKEVFYFVGKEVKLIQHNGIKLQVMIGRLEVEKQGLKKDQDFDFTVEKKSPYIVSDSLQGF